MTTKMKILQPKTRCKQFFFGKALKANKKLQNNIFEGPIKILGTDGIWKQESQEFLGPYNVAADYDKLTYQCDGCWRETHQSVARGREAFAGGGGTSNPENVSC